MPNPGYEPFVDNPDGRDDDLQHSKLLDDDKNSIVKPAVYYGEGEFDPPSSDDEDHTLLEKDETDELQGNIEDGVSSSRYRDRLGGKRPTSIRFLVISLASLVVLSGIIGIIAAHTYSGSAYHPPGAKRVTMDHIFNGTFQAQRQSLRWVPEAGDGVFSIEIGTFIQLVDLKTNHTKTLVSSMDVRDEHGNLLSWSNWKLSPDMKYILFQADYKKQWRWSSHGNYYVHNIETQSTHPIVPATNPPTIAYATWSPTGESIAFVQSNDLYILPSPTPSTSPIRITTSGNASLFHGVPDWVYEEEIFSADYALWWSPDSRKVAFLRFDETDVDEFSFPVYNPTDDSNAVIPYTSEVTMKYPKPGYNNPLVSVHVFDLQAYLDDTKTVTTGFPAANATLELDWEGRHPANDSIILEVAWASNTSLILKEVNRNADAGSVVVFDLDVAATTKKSHGSVVRKLGKDGEEGDSGWINNEQNIHPVHSSGSGAYLDIVPTREGYNHIALFDSAKSTSPRFLTSGPWEVAGGIRAVDREKGLVYFLAANPSSIERHLYSVPLPKVDKVETVEPTPLTDITKQSSYGVDFSPEAGFYLLSYEGPSIPWQKVVQVGESGYEYMLTNNEALANTTEAFEAPVISYGVIDSDGYELNYKEMRPPRMDDSGRTKYPVLFRVYGGPNSQLVELKFERDWHAFVTCALGYVVVIVDGRGTGFKGRKLRNPVKDNLGFWETRDQVNAARVWAAKEYVDSKRIGIWGWSYGGFMSSKVVEADAGIHSLAMAVAPVTSWRLYDSIYTERYMNLPALNEGGYVNASISNVTAFHKVDYLLAHGSADDNVHYANSAHLLDMFTRAQVRNFRFRMFTDSDHSIRRRGGYREVYEYLTEFLVEKWGRGGRRRGW